MNTNWSNLNNEEHSPEVVVDTVISTLYKARQTREREREREDFGKWLTKKTDEVSVSNVLEHLCRDVIKSVSSKGFVITNEKLLKNEIATFIYKEASCPV